MAIYKWAGGKTNASAPTPPPPPPSNPEPPSPPPPQPDYQLSLPTPLRTVNVSNVSQLLSAVNSAQPGDRIVLENGTYSHTSAISLTKSGTSQNPVVIVAKNVLGAAVPKGFNFAPGTSNIWLWGIDLKDATNCRLEGTYHKIVRCRIWPKPQYSANGFSTGIMPYNGSDCEIAYCELRLHTTQEAQAENSSLWGNDTTYGVIWSYFSSSGANLPFYRLKISRCLLTGGPSGVPYGNPNCQFIEASTSPSVAYDLNCDWSIEDCYGNVTRDKTLLDFKCRGFKLKRCHIISPTSGSIQVREARDHQIDQCRLSGFIELTRGPGNIITNTITGTYYILAGQCAYNQFITPTYHGQAYKTTLINCSGTVVVGKKYGSDYTYPALDTLIEKHTGSITYENHQNTVVRPNVQTSGVTLSSPVTMQASQVGPFGQASDQPAPPPPLTDQELPQASRTVNVTNTTELTNALNNAIPGDHIVLENGTYDMGGRIQLTKSGTSQNPIVIRAKNVLQAKLPKGFEFGSSTTNVWLWGIDFKGASNNFLRGTNNIIRRCQIWPDPVFNGTSVGIQVEKGSDCRVDYCTIRLYTNAEISDLWPNSVWESNSMYQGIRGYTSYASGNRFNKLTVVRCHFLGGLNQVSAYNKPYLSLFSNHGGFAEDIQSGYRHEWVVRLSRVDSQCATNVMNFNNSGNIFDRVHIVGNNLGTAKFRYSGWCKMTRSRLENCRFEIMGGYHQIDNSIAPDWYVFAGTVPWDSVSDSDYPACKEVKLSRCSGNVTVGYSYNSNHIYPADGTIIEAHRSGTITLVQNMNTNTVQTSQTSVSDLSSISLSTSDVGVYATWMGLE